jgi:hypothetical protein
MTPKYDWALDFFGGRNPEKDFAFASNLMFVNGDLDPWHAGGVTTNITENTITLFIKDSAHHLDLRLPNAEDPASVTSARSTIMAHVKRWIEDFQGMTIDTPLSTELMSGDTCLQQGDRKCSSETVECNYDHCEPCCSGL